MSAYFESVNLSGFAQWMRVQNEEERLHAMKLYDHMHDRGGRIVLQALEQPKMDYGSALEVFETALKHEQKVTASINALYTQAQKENDYAAQVMLQWFITEQVEEEKNATQIQDKLRMIGNDPSALFMLDEQLGTRATAGAGAATTGEAA
jgi:ferritin